jgi:hypothetical protein
MRHSAVTARRIEASARQGLAHRPSSAKLRPASGELVEGSDERADEALAGGPDGEAEGCVASEESACATLPRFVDSVASASREAAEEDARASLARAMRA